MTSCDCLNLKFFFFSLDISLYLLLDFMESLLQYMTESRVRNPGSNY